jgi:hypothetical protein
MRKTIAILLILFIFNGYKSIAATDSDVKTSLGVFPAIVEIVLDPNSSVETKVTITNLSNFAQPIKAIKQSFTPGEKSSLNAEELKIYDASSWIYISPEESDFILQPKESKDINLIITQPKDATPGGHYATIYFQPLIPQELISTESIFVYARVAVLVFMQTPGDIIENMNFKEVNYDYLSNPGTINFDLDLENSGNTHIQPVGNVKIYNLLNSELVQTISFPTSIILPGTTKTFNVEIKMNDLMGLYYMETELNYGSDSIYFSSGQKNFMIFPYTIFLFLILPLLFILLYIIRFKNRIKTAFNILLNKSDPEETKVTSFPSHLYKLEPRLKFKVRKGN